MVNLKCVLLLLFLKSYKSEDTISLKKILFREFEGASNSNLTKCQKALQATEIELISEKWARKMVDSIGKIPSGLMNIKLSSLGSFDECLSIKSYHKIDTIYGKYCLTKIYVDKLNQSATILEGILTRSHLQVTGLGFEWGICIPNVCSSDEIQGIFDGTALKVVKITEKNCQSKPTMPNVTTGDIIVITIFGVIAVLIILSTAYDYYLGYHKEEKKRTIFLAFSIITNGRKLFQFQKCDEQISCIHGIRAISGIWIAFCHFVVMREFTPLENYTDLYEWFNRSSSMYIFSGILAVETFFLLSGTLLSYLFMKSQTKNWFNIPLFYLRRYLRLTPVVAALLAVHLTIIKHIGSGPRWPLGLISFTENCKIHWWGVLLYVQNYFAHPYEKCIGQSWYLNIDMQLFLLSPIILVPLKKFTKIVLTVVSIAALCSTAWAFFLGWENKYSAMPFTWTEDYLRNYYTALHVRSMPWLLGIILGYLLHEYHEFKFGFKTRYAKTITWIVLWIFSIIILAFSVFGPYKIVFEERDSRILNAIHLGIIRLAWTVAISWIIFACKTGHGGFINSLLSLPIFQVLSRLTYTIYVLHMTLVEVIYYSARGTFEFSDSILVYEFSSYFTLLLIISTIWSLAFEWPVAAILKVLQNNGN